ncbi:hypothetical protein GCM10018790_79790 [Kitasatospora xanthocidica]|uniref:hypothetical protein n=1 Tax=Kitasatospora xanthocidica TaxID=83382 RepID=UPI0016767623|nr:hypothetical protein [Kitasatospora xanthocidica]GHF90666.1 hypothetical protein GCM10018790_79790 [Kitasatospora xanthocidica]
MARKAQTDPDPRRPRRRRLLRTLVAIVVCGTAVGGLAVYRAVSDETGERPVTTDEASRLALSRLNLYQAAPVGVTLTATEGGGVSIRVEGVVDYRTHRGVGRYRTTGASGPLDHGLVVWDTGGLGLAPEPAGVDGPAWQQAEHVPRQAWSPRSYTADPLDAGLSLIVQLGADRPDNPLLLAQSGARWLGRDRIDGRGYDRFAGPRAQGSAPDGERSPLTYWVDGDGALRRVTMRMPGLGTPATADFTGHDGAAKLPEAPWLTG